MKITKLHCLPTLAALSLAVVSLANTGCQVTEAGQTLPSGYYATDDIQYFPPGPEFKLSREAAAQKAYKSDIEAQQAAAAIDGRP